jgi:hypothetical protein
VGVSVMQIKDKVKSFNITISVTVTIKFLYEAIGKNLNLNFFSQRYHFRGSYCNFFCCVHF